MKKFIQGILWFIVFIALFWLGTCWGDSIGYERGKKEAKPKIIHDCPEYASEDVKLLK